MRARSLAVIAMSTLLFACSRQPVNPTFSGRSAAPTVTAQKRAMTYDWTIWEYWRCTVDWRHYCEGRETAQAPSGWQVCKPFFRVASAGKGGPTFTARMRPDYVHVDYHFYVAGSGNVFDQWGSHLNVENIGMTIISAPTTPAERQAAGCIP
jgi:hypothetical protein